MNPWTAASFFMLGAGGLVVDTPSPDALCPPLEQTRESVRSRLGSVELEGTWRASYVVVHRKEGDFVALTLSDPDGVPRLERELPAEGESCSTLAQVIALVLERYFVRPEGAASKPEEPPASPPEAAAQPAPSAPSTSSARPPDSAPPGPSVPALVRFARPESSRQAELALGLWATTEWLAPFARAELELMPRTSLVAGIGFDMKDHELGWKQGWVRARRLPMALTLVRDITRSGPWGYRLGAGLVGVYERVSTQDLGSAESYARLIPGIGMGASIALRPLGSPWSSFLEATGAYLARGLAPDFQIDHESVLRPRPVVLGIAWGVGWRL